MAEPSGGYRATGQQLPPSMSRPGHGKCYVIPQDHHFQSQRGGQGSRRGGKQQHPQTRITIGTTGIRQVNANKQCTPTVPRQAPSTAKSSPEKFRDATHTEKGDGGKDLHAHTESFTLKHANVCIHVTTSRSHINTHTKTDKTHRHRWRHTQTYRQTHTHTHTEIDRDRYTMTQTQ